jgi:hypothetical protein
MLADAPEPASAESPLSLEHALNTKASAATEAIGFRHDLPERTVIFPPPK